MKTIRRILVPVDFSPCSAAALVYAAELAQRLDAEVDVLHAWRPAAAQPLGGFVGLGAEPLAEFAGTDAGGMMKWCLEALEQRGIDAHGRLEFGDPCEAILDVAAEDYDLVIMGTNGRTGIAHLLQGSVAEKIVRRAPCPVLTIRAAAPEEDIPAVAAAS